MPTMRKNFNLNILQMDACYDIILLSQETINNNSNINPTVKIASFLKVKNLFERREMIVS